jgi:hypothetical protein
MNRSMLVLVTVLSLASLAGCSQTAHPSDTNTTSSPATPAGYSELVGKWSFVYTAERRAAVEAELARTIADPTELAKAKKEAEEESNASEIEFTADRTFLSRVAGKEILRDRFEVTEASGGALVLKAPSFVGIGVSVTFRDPNTIVVRDRKMVDLVYSRLR